MNKHLSFVKADHTHLNLVKNWLNTPHVKEFWGDDGYTYNNFSENVIRGNKVLFDYWIAYYDTEAFALIMTSDAKEGEPEHLMPYVDSDGDTMTIDFLIGNSNFLGRGLSSKTLESFFEYVENLPEKKIAAYLLDPECKNKKAIHIYQKSGFEIVSQFTPNDGEFKGVSHYLMKRKSANKLQLQADSKYIGMEIAY